MADSAVSLAELVLVKAPWALGWLMFCLLLVGIVLVLVKLGPRLIDALLRSGEAMSANAATLESIEATLSSLATGAQRTADEALEESRKTRTSLKALASVVAESRQHAKHCRAELRTLSTQCRGAADGGPEGR